MISRDIGSAPMIGRKTARALPPPSEINTASLVRRDHSVGSAPIALSLACPFSPALEEMAWLSNFWRGVAGNAQEVASDSPPCVENFSLLRLRWQTRQ